MSLYIFLLYYIYHLCFTCIDFLWPLRLGWLLVCCLYKEVYLQIFKRVSFWLHGCCGEWEGWARKPVNHTSWVAVVTPTDRPKSVRNRCVIELFCDVVYVVILPFWQFCWCRGFCHRTESDLLLFLLHNRTELTIWTVCAIQKLNPHQWPLAKQSIVNTWTIMSKIPKTVEVKRDGGINP